jgi:alkylation response protein AidB-like acyl-CoA dehydrogenase
MGGLGAGFAQYVAVAMVLAQASPATALLFNMHVSVTGGLAGLTPEVAAALGADEHFADQREQALRRAADGAFHAVAISEPGTGSRLSQVRTTYEPHPDGYRLQGVKSPSSGASHADAYLVAARSGSDEPPVISYFLVPAGDGVEVTGVWDAHGMRATDSLTVTLDTVVPRHALLGVEGVAVALAHLMPQWLVASYAAVYAGVALAAVRLGAEELANRPDVSSAVRSRLGRADASAQAAVLAVERAALAVDRAPGEPETNRWVYRAKLLAGDAAMDAAGSVAEACGLRVLQRGHPLERMLRDARLGAVMPPRSDVCADHLCAVALGMDPATTLEDPPW